MSQLIDSSVMFKLSYGLFILTAKDGLKDNGCIINTAVQIADNPKRISISVNKSGYTHEIISKTGKFNLSVLTEQAPFKVFEHFGFQSGSNTDKFSGCTSEERAENGIIYIPKYTNAFISGNVLSTVDCGTHTLFIAEVTQAQKLSEARSSTYDYYFANIKPKQKPQRKKGYICKICGYVYEGDELPEDFVCPVCKHGAADFEPVQNEERKSKMKKYTCLICGYVYDEEKEGVKWEDLPEDWACPICGASKNEFEE